MYFPARGTHITRDMCFPGRGTHIPRDMCFPERGTHITRVMGFMSKGTNNTKDTCFPGGCSLVDSIFILKTLIDKFVKSKPQKRRNLLFLCFVDFRKAFDRIPRQKLFEKLRKEGIKGRFLEIVMSMYSKDKSAVKIINKMTEAFPCYTRVKQGCMSSPNVIFICFFQELSQPYLV